MKLQVVRTQFGKDGKELSNAASPDFIKPDSVYEKLQEISGEIQVLSAKLDGKDIV